MNLSGSVGLRTREQVRAAVRPALQHPPLLCDDIGLELLVDGDSGFAFHLGVEVTQVGSTLAVVQEAVELQREGTGDAQPAADQDERDPPAGRVGPAGEVVGGLDLGHDVLGEPPVDFLGDRWGVAGEEHRGAGQGVVPTVLADRGEQQVHAGDGVLGDLEADLRAALRHQLQSSLEKSAEAAFTPPTLGIEPVTIIVPRQKQNGVAQTIINAATKSGGSGAKALPNENSLKVLVLIPASAEAQFRQMLAGFGAPPPPSPGAPDATSPNEPVHLEIVLSAPR